MEWDEGEIFYSQQERRREPEDTSELTNAIAKNKFKDFIDAFENREGFIYRDQLMSRHKLRQHFLEVEMQHIMAVDETLHTALREEPARMIPLFEVAIHEQLKKMLGRDLEEEDVTVPQFQVVIKSRHEAKSIRDVKATDVNHMIVLSGIVINASRARPQATSLVIRCRNCNHTETIPINNPFTPVALPRRCGASDQAGAVAANPAADENSCPLDPYVIEPDRSKYVDQQTLKLQEDNVDTGEMPRHILMSLNRHLVDIAKPGNHVRVVGVSSVFNPKANNGQMVSRPFIKVLSIEVENQHGGRGATSFTKEEETAIRDIAKDPSVYERVWKGIAPSVSGSYTDDIKKAIACLLVGGTRRVLPDGMKLRGDINVLLLGDPSTAKSQFLKFVNQVAPVGVYTSGKGSSAAGLTASVIRDSKGEFYLEGGAMVLADGGVVCIDEFDKMREEDRVAIHEAMEQQTISVAKAGITTILNARSAVLAAANPVFGRYDDRHSPAENIDFLPSILSRFDLIFIVRDVRDRERDLQMARAVMGLFAADSHATIGEGEQVNTTLLKKYISYCRQRCAPTLSAKAADVLAREYVKIRQGQRRLAHDSEQAGSTIPITVRQLQAITRVSEALAKMRLKAGVDEDDVKEAVRLFKSSTLSAAKLGMAQGETGLSGDARSAVQAIEQVVRGRLPIGSQISQGRLVEELKYHNFNERLVRTAITIMLSRKELKNESGVRYLRRLK